MNFVTKVEGRGIIHLIENTSYCSHFVRCKNSDEANAAGQPMLILF